MKFLKKYNRVFLLEFLSAMEYRTNFFLNISSGVFFVIIQYFLWNAVFMSSQTKIVYGYTFSEMITYSIMAGVIAKFMSSDFSFEIAKDIKDGGLNKFIVQPINYFFYKISGYFGRQLSQLPIFILILFVAIVICNAFFNFKIDVLRVVLFFPFIFLAQIQNFLIYYIISTLAFSLSEVWGILIITSKLILILGGGMFPLDVFGKSMSKVLNLLPFKYMVFYPINILNGKLSIQDILYGAAVESVWLIILSIAANKFWKYGIKKYIAVGG